MKLNLLKYLENSDRDNIVFSSYIVSQEDKKKEAIKWVKYYLSVLEISYCDFMIDFNMELNKIKRIKKNKIEISMNKVIIDLINLYKIKEEDLCLN